MKPLGWTAHAGAMALLAALALAAALDAEGPRVAWLAGRTLLLAAGALAVALPAGLAAAVLIARTDAPGRRTAAVLLGLGLFLPLLLHAAGWEAALGKQGWALPLLGYTGAEPPLASWRGAVWVHGVAAIPWVALVVGLGLRQTDAAAEEAALLETSPLGVLVHVTMPAAAGAIAAAALWVLVVAAGEITVTDLFQVRTYAEEIYLGFAQGDTLVEASRSLPANALVLAAALYAAGVLAWRLAPGGDTPPAAAPVFRCRPRWLAGAMLAAIALATVAAPLANLAIQLGVVVERDAAGGLVRRWSLARAGELLAAAPWGSARDWRPRSEMVATAAIAGGAALLSLALAAPLAWSARRGGWRSTPALAAAALTLALPGPLVGLGWIVLWNRPEVSLAWFAPAAADAETAPLWTTPLVWLYRRTLAPPIVAAATRALPLAILFCWHVFRRIDDDVLAAAALDGAGPLRRFCEFGLRANRRLLAGGGVALAAIAAGDLSATIYVIPPGVETLTIRIFGLAHAGMDNQLAALSLWFAAGQTLLAAAFFALVARRRGS